MNFHDLIARLPGRRGFLHTFEKGKPVSHSYAALHRDVMAAGARLRGMGVRAGMRVGIFAPSSYLWLVHDLALIDIGAVSVAFTDDFQGRMDGAVLDRYGIALLLVPKAARLGFAERPAHVAFLDGTNDAQAREWLLPLEGDEEDQHSLVFSSGSSGGLKGLVISRQGVCATLAPILDAMEVRATDRLLLFLPMSNFQQRFLCYGALWYDFDVILTDFVSLFPAMKALQPTILLAPPVFYQMVQGEYRRRPGWQRALWQAAGTLLALVPGQDVRQAMARHLFADFHREFGGRMRMLITGMAPIRREMAAFFQKMQLPLCEAYGMVEAGVMTFRPAGSKDYGSVGRPLRGVTFTVAPDGELLVSRERPLTLRYFQSAPGENERTFVGPKRIATGDMGRFLPNGSLAILGRKGEMIVTASGQKIHPEVIEHELGTCSDIAHAVVFQRPELMHLSCVVSLHTPHSEEAKARVQQFAKTLRTTRNVSAFMEMVFTDAPFSRENGMLRPNMKVDRRNIAAMYQSGALPTA